MKRFYENPSVELIALRTTDVITVSLQDGYGFDEFNMDHVYDITKLDN